MIDEFKKAGVDPKDVFAQSFDKNDILYWIEHEPRFRRQAVYLDDIDPSAKPPLPQSRRTATCTRRWTRSLSR
jgi:glycerophosphoryl diester phosphodiesterase